MNLNIKVVFMNLRKTHKLEKYAEITISGELVKDKINFSNMSDFQHIICDFSLDANIFYGIKEGRIKFNRINTQDFDNYDVVLRLINWSKNHQQEYYTFKILKANPYENVDFEEEKIY